LIEVCGIAGGRLPNRTGHGWRLLIRAGGMAAEHEAGHRDPFTITGTEEVRAAGFSSDGSTLIVAASPGVTICRHPRYEAR